MTGQAAGAQTVKVETEEDGTRLDACLAARAELGLTRSHLQKLIEEGLVMVNGRRVKPSYKVVSGDSVEVRVPPPEPAELRAEELPIDILYEDADVIVVNKSRGLVVHPAAGHRSGTLVNALLHHCGDLSGINDQIRPGIVHRLDKDTTGTMMAAKNDRAHLSLAAQIKDRRAKREYLALVRGNPPVDSGVVDAPIGRHPTDRKRMAVINGGRPAVTHFRVIERYGEFSLLRCRLETGRTHQVRVHLSSIGLPVVGDPVYGQRKDSFGLEGQALHAASLGFFHPRTREWMEFEAPLPEDFQRALDRLRS